MQGDVSYTRGSGSGGYSSNSLAATVGPSGLPVVIGLDLSQSLLENMETSMQLGATQELGRSPTIGELATATRASEEEVVEAVEAGRAFNTRSIDLASPHSPPVEVERALRQVDTALERADERLLVARLLDTLEPRERLIMRLRYWERLSQSEIALRLGISQMHVSRLLARSLARFQEELGENPLED